MNKKTKKKESKSCGNENVKCSSCDTLILKKGSNESKKKIKNFSFCTLHNLKTIENHKSFPLSVYRTILYRPTPLM